MWVRAKDWVPRHHPGRFSLTINDVTLDTEFGANGLDWAWQPAGVIGLPSGETTLVLRDLTGFDGRCDALYLGRDETPPPNGADDSSRAWRRRLRGVPDIPVAAGEYDVVVVGGGVTGCAAALTAARLGCRVALLQDRPYLGGNASVEVGLSPRGETGPLIDELSERTPDGDLRALELLVAEPTATVVREQTVFNVVVDETTIVAVDARDARSGLESRYHAPIFIDCTGTAILGLLAGADTLFGQESQAEFGESLAPEHRDDMHHGNTVFFRTRKAQNPVPFPAVPWALDVAKDYANLSGQLEKPGVENGLGPVAGEAKTPDPSVRRRMTHPLTHFWEYGQWLDPYTEGERIRDHLLCAIYGTFSNVKQLEPDTYANLELDWVAYVPAQGEYRRRYRGDYILTEGDIRTHRQFPDAVVQNSGAFCLHYPGDEKYDFRLKDWKWDVRDEQPYAIPFRCLYSANIQNLMMAGKHISVTHVAGSNTKFMGNGGQHGIATAAAAFLCTKYRCTPRKVYEAHLRELKNIAATITGVEPD
ncbi:FAD-dependent oxidoreductase [Mycolicibacterium sp. Dal123E01]|uniref:FAD-dependent oxidoreductase n=1 Tax=Mycolicibacterium sp. Dal123E01 TaxID=3457578 RepID=UPI00403ED5A5